MAPSAIADKAAALQTTALQKLNLNHDPKMTNTTESASTLSASHSNGVTGDVVGNTSASSLKNGIQIHEVPVMMDLASDFNPVAPKVILLFPTLRVADHM
jgi:hypothetical protein